MMDMQTLFESQKRAHWQQAKGHLMAMLEFYVAPETRDYPDHDHTDFDKASTLIEIFVKDMEDQF